MSPSNLPSFEICGESSPYDAADHLQLTVSFFRNRTDNDPLQQTLTWRELKDRHYRCHAVAARKDGPAFSPTEYEPGTTRKAENVQTVSCAVFDLDDAPDTEALKSKLAGYSWILHTSYSHTPERPKLRLIVPFAKKVPAQDWAATRAKLDHWMSGMNDKATKDPCRLYYLPSHFPGAPGHFIESGDGCALDVGDLTDVPVSAAPPPRAYPGQAGMEAADPGSVALGPAEGLLHVVERCRFMQDLSAPEGQITASRGLWRAMLSNAAMFEDADEWIHAASAEHPEYDQAVTHREIESSRSFGSPLRCETIQGEGYRRCPSGGCKTASGRVTGAPAGLWPPVQELPIGLPGSEYTTRCRGFEVSDRGVFARKVQDGEVHLSQVSSRIELLAQTVDENDRWGYEVALLDPDGQRKIFTMERGLLASPGSFRRELLDMGADVWPGTESYDPLYDYYLRNKPTARVRRVTRTGWHIDSAGLPVFVLPEATFGETDERFSLRANADASRAFAVSGTLQRWKESVGTLCVGNSRLITAVCAALAGPALRLLNEENGGLHFVGPSSIGKTTTVEVAASVWGRRDAFVKTWRTTTNGLEGVAASHNDTLLILDEISQVNPAEAGEVAYMLGNGRGKVRAARDGSPRDVPTFRLLYLSTGERSLSETMKGKALVTAGQQVRLINVPADAGAGLGVFEDLRGRSSGQQLSNDIKRATLETYGSAGRAFAQLLCAPGSDLVDIIKAEIDQFASSRVPADGSGQVHRVARRFGLLAAVGELAVQHGIVPWQPGEATAGVSACLHAWLGDRGNAGDHEEQQAVDQVRLFLEENGEARFTAWQHGAEEVGNADSRTIRRAGFRKATDDARTEFYVLPEVYKSEICAGLDPKEVTKALIRRGYLELGTPKQNGSRESVCQKRLPGIGSKRVYVIKADIMND